MSEAYQRLAVHTAKAVVGLDLQSRRTQGALTMVALVPPDHVHLLAMQEAGRRRNDAKEAAKAAGYQKTLHELKWVHLQIWVALCLSIAGDGSIDEGKKAKITAHSKSVTSVAQLEASVLVCQQKKAFKQNGWKTDMYRVELFTIPELRDVCFEMMEAILSKPNSIRKPGAPPRGPHIRSVVQELIDLGEYKAEGEGK